MNTNLAIENSRESSLADYASLSVILISVLLICFSIVLLANDYSNGAPPAVEKSLSGGLNDARIPKRLVRFFLPAFVIHKSNGNYTRRVLEKLMDRDEI